MRYLILLTLLTACGPYVIQHEGTVYLQVQVDEKLAYALAQVCEEYAHRRKVDDCIIDGFEAFNEERGDD